MHETPANNHLYKLYYGICLHQPTKLSSIFFNWPLDGAPVEI